MSSRYAGIVIRSGIRATVAPPTPARDRRAAIPVPPRSGTAASRYHGRLIAGEYRRVPHTSAPLAARQIPT